MRPRRRPKKLSQTMVMQRGVSLTELEQGARGAGFDTKGSGFQEGYKVNKIVIASCIFPGCSSSRSYLSNFFAIAGNREWEKSLNGDSSP